MILEVTLVANCVGYNNHCLNARPPFLELLVQSSKFEILCENGTRIIRREQFNGYGLRMLRLERGQKYWKSLLHGEEKINFRIIPPFKEREYLEGYKIYPVTVDDQVEYYKVFQRKMSDELKFVAKEGKFAYFTPDRGPNEMNIGALLENHL